MCGIVGYIGKKDSKECLLTGLYNLEYRGYDSAGIAVKKDNKIDIIKSVGKISNLENKIKKEKINKTNIGIGHTRWATHGEPNETNAHPHKCGDIILVHNGIIENAKELKEDLIKKGETFYSDTDTEVACALINHYYKKEKDTLKAINKAIKELKGSYAFAIINVNENRIYATRKDSPLIIGVKDKESFVASDIAAIIEYTNEYILLEPGEIAILDEDGYKITKNLKEIKKDILKTDLTASSNDKNGYEHYMLKEIMEEPVLLEKMFEKNINNIPDISKYDEVHIVACGSALYAGMIGKFLLEKYVHISALCECASEYRYNYIAYPKNTLVILISQSGETADTIAALRKAKEAGAHTLAVVNVETSTIARESDERFFITAGPEIAVATTKAYMLQVGALSLISYNAAKKKKLIDFDIEDDLKLIPKLVKETIDKRDEYKKIAKEIYERDNIFFIGRLVDHAMCLEGSLKLKEVSYIHSEAYAAGELKHGTISLISKGTPVFAIVTDDDIRDKTLSNIEEVDARGAKSYIITNEETKLKDEAILVPKVNPFVTPLVVVPILQLIAYETAYLRGCDIDKPKNLAKSVTVE